MTLHLYNTIVEKLPPTPARFHYIFNLRDLSRIYQGLMLSTEDHYDSPDKFIRLWRNEALRVFHDRLIDDSDREVFNAAVEESVQKKFGSFKASVLNNPILFGEFGSVLDESQPRMYKDLNTYEDIKPTFVELLERYNSKHKAMNLVFFADALEHLTRITRLFAIARGCALSWRAGPSATSRGRRRMSVPRTRRSSRACTRLPAPCERGRWRARIRYPHTGTARPVRPGDDRRDFVCVVCRSA